MTSVRARPVATAVVCLLSGVSAAIGGRVWWLVVHGREPGEGSCTKAHCPPTWTDHVALALLADALVCAVVLLVAGKALLRSGLSRPPAPP